MPTEALAPDSEPEDGPAVVLRDPGLGSVGMVELPCCIVVMRLGLVTSVEFLREDGHWDVVPIGGLVVERDGNLSMYDGL